MKFDDKRIEQLLEQFGTAPIVKTFGMRLSFHNLDQIGLFGAVVDLPYNEKLNHFEGGIHGGVYCTIIDTAAWFTSAACTPLSTWVATSDLNIRFLEPVSNTSLKSIGKIIKIGKRQIISSAEVYNGTKLVGMGTGSFTILKEIKKQRPR